MHNAHARLALMIAAVLLACCASGWAEEIAVRGMFGERRLGGPITPGQRSRFDNGIQRGPSGNILGLQRGRTASPYAYDRGRSSQFAPSGEPVLVVPVVPVVPPSRVTPREGWMRTYPAPPARAAVQAPVRTPRPSDTWFRTPTRRGR